MSANEVGGEVRDTPPVMKYALTVTIYGNTHEEIETELDYLTRGGYELSSNHGSRDEFEVFSGRCHEVLAHTNPDQTPENYRAEVAAWQARRRATTPAASSGAGA